MYGIAAAAFLLALLASCETPPPVPFPRSGDIVTIKNDSDTWVTARLHVGDGAGAPSTDPGFISLMSIDSHRKLLGPEEEATFDLAKNPRYRNATDRVVRLQVAPRAASFTSEPDVYWVEIISPPPTTVSIAGPRGNLKFNSSIGELVPVPQKYWLRDSSTGAYTLP